MAAIASVGGGSVSSLVIVPAAVAVVIVPPHRAGQRDGERLVGLHRRVAVDVDGDHLRGLAGVEGHAAAGKHAAGEVGRVGRIGAAAGDRVGRRCDAPLVSPLRVTVKVKGVLPRVAFRLVGVGGGNRQRGRRHVSSLMIVPAAAAVADRAAAPGWRA